MAQIGEEEEEEEEEDLPKIRMWRMFRHGRPRENVSNFGKIFKTNKSFFI